jgi:hypothetical protein
VNGLFLDEEQLERFECSLRTAGAGIVDHWNAGLSDGAIEEIAGAHGLILAEEARVLWRWHDGMSQDAPGGARDIAPGRRFLSLATVITNYEPTIGGYRDLYGTDRIIEPFTGKPMIYFDCCGQAADPVPILVSHDFEEPKQTLPSVGDLFALWTRFIDDGLWTIGTDGRWDGDYIDRLTDEILERGVY